MENYSVSCLFCTWQRRTQFPRCWQLFSPDNYCSNNGKTKSQWMPVSVNSRVLVRLHLGWIDLQFILLNVSQALKNPPWDDRHTIMYNPPPYEMIPRKCKYVCSCITLIRTRFLLCPPKFCTLNWISSPLDVALKKNSWAHPTYGGPSGTSSTRWARRARFTLWREKEEMRHWSL